MMNVFAALRAFVFMAGCAYDEGMSITITAGGRTLNATLETTPHHVHCMNACP